MTKLRLTILFLLLIFTVSTNAQLRFQKTIGGPVLDWANAIEQTPDSGYIILGSTKNFGAGLQDLFLIKINEFGDTLWTRSFGGSTNDEEGATVRRTTDGGYIIAGTTLSFGAGLSDYFLLKTDGSGNILWSKTYGGTSIDLCIEVAQCFDGGYLVSGNTNSFGAGSYDGWLVRTNATGDTLWSKTIGTTNFDEIYDVKQTTDSGFIVTGTSTIPGLLKEATLIKLDLNGNIIWSKSYGTAIDEIGHSVVQTNDGGYFIGAETVVPASISADMYLIKTDANGDTLWTRLIIAGANDVINSVLQNDDSGYTITGFTNSFGLGGDDLLVLRTNSIGQVQWVEAVGGFSNAKDEARTVSKTNDGGFIVAGYTQSFGAGGGADIFLVKTDSLGNSGCNNVNVSFTEQVVTSNVNSSTGIVSGVANVIITNPTTIQNYGGGIVNVACTTVGVIETISNKGQILIYPNPFISSANVQINGTDIGQGVIFTIYDTQSRLVTKTIFNGSGTNQITDVLFRNQLTAGMYFYNVNAISDGRLIGNGKLVAQ